jgi:hypothetical protein
LFPTSSLLSVLHVEELSKRQAVTSAAAILAATNNRDVLALFKP